MADKRKNTRKTKWNKESEDCEKASSFGWCFYKRMDLGWVNCKECDLNPKKKK